MEECYMSWSLCCKLKLSVIDDKLWWNLLMNYCFPTPSQLSYVLDLKLTWTPHAQAPFDSFVSVFNTKICKLVLTLRVMVSTRVNLSLSLSVIDNKLCWNLFKNYSSPTPSQLSYVLDLKPTSTPHAQAPSNSFVSVFNSKICISVLTLRVMVSIRINLSLSLSHILNPENDGFRWEKLKWSMYFC